MARWGVWGQGLGVMLVLAAGCQLETVQTAVVDPDAGDEGPRRQPPAAPVVPAAPPADPPPANPPPPPAADPPEPAGCRPPFVAQVCDPVCNTGCPLLSRCDVGSNPGQGVCIGAWLGGESARCWRTANADSCAPQLTCFADRCRRLCYQDRDCTGTEKCCNIDLPSAGDEGESAASSGFKGCGPCD